MTIRTIDNNNKSNFLVPTVLFIDAGGIIGAATYVGLISQDTRIAMKIGMAIISLASWLIFCRIDQLQQYKGLAMSFFAVSLGVLLSHFLATFQ